VSRDRLAGQGVRRIGRRGRPPAVLAGLEAAERVGFHPIKVNAVLMRDFNADEAVPLARWGRERGYQVRFIEWMPLDFQHGWSREKLVPADEILAQIDAEFPLEPARVEDPGAPATRYR